MQAFLIAAAAMLVVSIPAAVLVVRGGLMDAVVAYEQLSSVAVMVLILLAQGLRRPGEFELPVVLALLVFGAGIVVVHSLERWL